MELVISSGHGLKVRGASGILDEVNESRKVVDRVAQLVRMANVGIKVFHDNVSASVSANLNAITNYHNAQKRDRDISVHFNAFSRTDNPRGTECLYATQQSLAAQVSSAMANAGGLINRGAKKRTDLAFLNRCKKPALLLEVCFVDSTADANLYQKNFEAICRGIAASISGVRIPGEPPPIIEPPPPPTVPELTGENVVEIAIKVRGNALVTLNRDPINETILTWEEHLAGRVALTLHHEGDVLVTVNGEDFQIEEGQPPPPPISRPTLRIGSRGNDVRIVQEALKARPVDGIFGTVTETAVKTFQREQQLTVDGVVGPITWAALERIFAWAFVTGSYAEIGASDDD